MRHIEKIKIDGTEYNLLGFSSYSFLPASASSWTELYRQSGDNYPWDMTAGHSFTTDTNLFPSLIAEGYPHHFDDYPEAYINKWYASSWNGIVFGFYYDPSNTILDYGYLNNSNEKNSTDMLGIILDDENRIGWAVIKHCYYPNNPTTVIRCVGGNSEMGQNIYSIFGIPLTLSGGAGSGYIGNSLLSNKKMVGYNVPTSSAESTKTESVNEVSANPVSGKSKSGNGFAKIKFLREPDYYWIAQYTVGGTTYNLMQIGDVTIPDSIINATQMTCTAITGRGSTIPSFVTNLGDLIFDLQSSIDADVTLEFINNSFLRFLFGRYDYIDSGTRMSGNQYYDVANSRVFSQSGWGNFSDGKVKYYIAIKIDKVNHRAYMIVLDHTYYHWAGNIGYMAYAIGGMPNGVDLLYETFKDVR